MECSRRYDLVNPSEPHIRLGFIVHENWVGIMLDDSMPYRPFMGYTCKLWDDGPFSSFHFHISTHEPIDGMDIVEARRVWETLVRDHGWRRTDPQVPNSPPPQPR